MDSVLKAVGIYLFLWLVIRISGRRAIGQLTIFEFVLLLIIGGATQRALTGEDDSLINAVVIVTTLVGMDIVVSLLEGRFKLFSKITRGVPMIIVEDGRPLLRRMLRARITEDEVMEYARRHHGLERMDEIKFAILEASGEISIVPQGKTPARGRKAGRART